VPEQRRAFPTASDSLKFAAIGDMGTGDKPQYEIGAQMNACTASSRSSW